MSDEFVFPAIQIIEVVDAGDHDEHVARSAPVCDFCFDLRRTMSTDHHGRPVYKVVRHGENNYKIAVPIEVAKKLENQHFAFELTEQGFAYEFLKDPPDEGLPEWFKAL